MKSLALLVLATATAHAWTAAEEEKGWIRSNDRDEWYHDGTIARVPGSWGASRQDDNPDTLELSQAGRRSMTIMITPAGTDPKIVKSIMADKAKDARARGAKIKPLTYKLAHKGETWVGSEFSTRERDDQGKAFEMAHIFGYVTDGTHYALVDFLEDQPTENDRPRDMLEMTLQTIEFGKRIPDEGRRRR